MSWEPTALIEALGDGVSVLTHDSTFVYANPAIARMAGLERGALIGKRMFEVYADVIGSDFHRAFDRVRTTGKAEEVDGHYARLDRWFRSHLYPLGEHIHVITRDITEQKHAERRLFALSRASHAFAGVLDHAQLFDTIARTLADLVGDGCVVRTRDGTDRLRAVAVHHPDPHRTQVLREFFARPLELGEGHSARVLATGEPMLVEHIDRQALGGTFVDAARRNNVQYAPTHSLIAAALGDGAERVGLVMILRDVTARAFTRADLSLLQDLVDRASMALTNARLYAAAQHEHRRALVVASASRAFSAAVRDQRAILDLLVRAAAAEVGEIAVANLISADGKYAEPVAFHADLEITAEIQALFSKPTPLAGSMTERIVATGTSLRLSNLDTEAFAASTRFGDTARRLQPKSFVLVPIKRGDRVLGTLGASRLESVTPYSDADVRLLEELADRAALAVENGRTLDAERLARQAAERIAAQTRRLEAIGSQLAHRRSAREVAETILRESKGVLGQATAAVWLLDPTGTQLDMLASIGYGNEARRFATLRLSDDIPLCSAVRLGKPLYLADLQEYSVAFPFSATRIAKVTPADFSTACLPLVSEGRAIGGLAFAFPHAHVFPPDERTFIEVLASQCAQAIDRSRLLDQERAASRALAETNRTLNAVINASPAAIVIADLEAQIRLWNPAAEAVFGWRAADVIGKPWPAVDDSQRAEVVANIARIARGESIKGLEMRRLRRNGSLIDVALWAAPIVRPDGEVQALAVFVDITDRKHAEEMARVADRRKDEFFAMLGHELRNPLAPILTALELMRIRGEIGGDSERAMIERQTRHLVRLVDDLLDISRITRGKIELRKMRVDLGAVIGHAVEASSPLLEQRGHHVSIAAPRNLVFVDGDEIRLAQIFQNLVTNAAKYTPSGGSITLQLTTRDGTAITEIEDNGEGIAAEVLPTIFDPFVQGARKLDRAQGGLGIGLTLVRSLCQLHGGEVEVHSDGPGRGSRFTVRLPLSLGIMREVQRTPEGMVALRCTPRRILLVDDNRDAAEMLAELLRAVGHEVIVAFDGPSALGSAPAFRPEIALVDIGLPVMDGYDLARKLRDTLPATPRLVAISGYGQEHDLRRSAEAGFEAHLVKPVQAAQVLAAVDDTHS